MPGEASLPDAGAKVRVEPVDDGKLWLVWLAAPKGNVLDTEMIEGLGRVFEAARGASDLRALIVQGEGKHFSFGASVEEHRAEAVGDMLPTFHRLFRTMLDAELPVLAAVSGQCLGGGLELAAFCHRVFARPDASLGQPEIVLGVFAPVGSLVLAERMGRPGAEDLCLSGRSVKGEEALGMGLVDALADDPGAAALEYARKHLLPHSASSLRMATRAVRLAFRERFVDQLETLERIYLDELMKTHDANEGINAFIEKRRPNWRNQ